MATKIEIKKAKVDFYEMEELACKILGLDYDEIDADTSVIEEAMYEQLEMSLEMFQDVLERLLPLVDKGQSPLTNEVYKGFADVENQCWLLRTKVSA